MGYEKTYKVKPFLVFIEGNGWEIWHGFGKDKKPIKIKIEDMTLEQLKEALSKLEYTVRGLVLDPLSEKRKETWQAGPIPNVKFRIKEAEGQLKDAKNRNDKAAIKKWEDRIKQLEAELKRLEEMRKDIEKRIKEKEEALKEKASAPTTPEYVASGHTITAVAAERSFTMGYSKRYKPGEEPKAEPEYDRDVPPEAPGPEVAPGAGGGYFEKPEKKLESIQERLAALEEGQSELEKGQAKLEGRVPTDLIGHFPGYRAYTDDDTGKVIFFVDPDTGQHYDPEGHPITEDEAWDRRDLPEHKGHDTGMSFDEYYDRTTRQKLPRK